MKKAILWILIIVVILLMGNRYYTMAEIRGCGYNPFNQVIKVKECWCCGDIPITNDFIMMNCNNTSVRYFGFTCYDCKELCE